MTIPIRLDLRKQKLNGKSIHGVKFYILLALMGTKYISAKDMLRIAYPGVYMPETHRNCLRVQISKLRKLLTPEWGITNVPGKGYTLERKAND